MIELLSKMKSELEEYWIIIRINCLKTNVPNEQCASLRELHECGIFVVFIFLTKVVLSKE